MDFISFAQVGAEDLQTLVDNKVSVVVVVVVVDHLAS